VKVNSAFFPESSSVGIAGVGESTEAAPDEKKSATGLPSLVEKVSVSPLTTET
jgi:hypothetical protein